MFKSAHDSCIAKGKIINYSMTCRYYINYLTVTSVDFSIASFKVIIGICVAVILLMALVLLSTIWICGCSSWRSQGERCYNVNRLTIYKHGVFW